MFDTSSAKRAGKKGGSTRSSKKQEAARVNGKSGGRPPSQNLAQRLLARPVLPEQQHDLELAWNHLRPGERQLLLEHFQASVRFGDPLQTTTWKSRSKRIPKEVRFVIKQFRLLANHYLKPVHVPKPYLFEWREKSVAAQEAWLIGHRESSVPCPPRRVRMNIRNLPYFSLFEVQAERGATLTVEGILERGGGEWTEARAKTAIAWLKYAAEHPSPDVVSRKPTDSKD